MFLQRDYTYSGYCSKDSGMRTIGNLWKGKYRERKPFSVNLVNGIWVIEGHIPNGNDSALTFCGQSYVEIRKSNGEIIKLLHTK